MNDIMKFTSCGKDFYLTSSQVSEVYRVVENQYLKEDAIQSIELYPCNDKKHDYLMNHLDDLVEIFIETEDQMVSNYKTWQLAIRELLRDMK